MGRKHYDRIMILSFSHLGKKKKKSEQLWKVYTSLTVVSFLVEFFQCTLTALPP